MDGGQMKRREFRGRGDPVHLVQGRPGIEISLPITYCCLVYHLLKWGSLLKSSRASETNLELFLLEIFHGTKFPSHDISLYTPISPLRTAN